MGSGVPADTCSDIAVSFPRRHAFGWTEYSLATCMFLFVLQKHVADDRDMYTHLRKPRPAVEGLVINPYEEGVAAARRDVELQRKTGGPMGEVPSRPTGER
jgi:hypothetical protein